MKLRTLIGDQLVVRALKRVDLSVEVAWAPQERSELVRLSARKAGCRCLVAVGGDGTVSDLLNERPSVPLTVLAAGTENLVAQSCMTGILAAIIFSAVLVIIALDRPYTGAITVSREPIRSVLQDMGGPIR